MNEQTYSLIIVFVCASFTALLRFIPFILFENKKLPSYVIYLGKVLPYSVMAMLVVYCLKDINIFSKLHATPEICASLAVVITHILKRNTLLSIIFGTIIYMILVQNIFY